jgi:hypothetical protein
MSGWLLAVWVLVVGSFLGASWPGQFTQLAWMFLGLVTARGALGPVWPPSETVGVAEGSGWQAAPAATHPHHV